MTEGLLVIELMLPLAAAFLVLLTGGRKLPCDLLPLPFAFLSPVLGLGLVSKLKAGEEIKTELIRVLPDLGLSFNLDALGAVFLLLTSSLWAVISLYSLGYMRSLQEHALRRFYCCFSLAIFGAFGVAMAQNLLTLFVFYEILTVSTFPLVAHEESEEALRAGRKYLVYLLSGATVGLFGLLWLKQKGGTLDFSVGGNIAGKIDPRMWGILFLLLAFGFGTKAAVMPFHEWLPSAMIAPTPVSALLHAVAVVKAGVFSCIRVILCVFGPKTLGSFGSDSVFAFAVAFTVIGANLLALSEDHLKRRLAFSTVNNLAVIILGAMLPTESGIKGAMIHIPFHGLMKITLFMCAGAIFVKTKKEYVNELSGLGKRMPITFGAFAVASLGLTGIPPICGFWSKWYLCSGALEAKNVAFLLVFLASSFLDAAYFLPIVYKAFFEGPGSQKVDEAPWTLTLPLIITALTCLLLGLFPDFLFGFLQFAEKASSAALMGG